MKMRQRGAQGSRCAHRPGSRRCRTVLADQKQWYPIAATYPDVALVGQRRHSLGIALKLAPLHLSRHTTILNFFRVHGKWLGSYAELFAGIAAGGPSAVSRSTSSGTSTRANRTDASLAP